MSGGCGLGFRPAPTVSAIKPGTMYVSSYTKQEVDSWPVAMMMLPSPEDGGDDEYPFDKEFD